MPVVLLVLICCVLGPAVQADDGRLIRIGSIWRYFKGTTEPASPLGSWRFPEFDDRNWPETMSGFSTHAYAPEPLYLTDYGLFYRTLYARKAFEVQRTNDFAELTLRVDYDDGFVAYLNGKEIARRGVIGPLDEPLPVHTYAAAHLRGITEEIDVTAALSLLRIGENVLAVQAFGSSTNDYTFAFVPELVANFTREPYVQNTTTNSTQIIFKTLAPAPAFIELGTNQTSAERILLEPGQTTHVASLAGLRPDTTYHYKVGAFLRGREILGDWHSFRTFKPSGKITFAMVGDTGWGSAGQHQIAAQLRQANPDFIGHLGDVVYGAFSRYAADFRLFSVYADQFYSTPMFLAIGNHEMYLNGVDALDAFYLPTNNITGTEHFYSFDHGDVHFAVVWSDLQAYANYSPGSPQYNWLDNDLGNTTKPWKFVFFHHVWRSSGQHIYDNYDFPSGDMRFDWTQLHEGPAALAQKHGVQIIFNGHDHHYERFTPQGGVVSFVSGGGGGILYHSRPNHPDSVQHEVRHHFLKVTTEWDVATVEAVGVDGKVFDQVHIARTMPERRTFDAAWHTPDFNAPILPDGDGNSKNDIFDFQGEAIGGRVGRQSSSGRLFVNQDNRFLYLGLEDVMLHTGDELFVFVETPGMAGVSDLRAYTGAPTNSIQTLSSLAFTNFSPAAAFVLGDEFGDAGQLNFVRAGTTYNTGQGGFYLTNTLALIPEQRVIQFNRLPNELPVPEEQNANFVKLAIPYESLNLRPGDRIKIGAVVGLRSTGAAARTLDAGLGYSFTENGGMYFLEPVEVQLQTDQDVDDDGLSAAEESEHGTDPTHPDSDRDGLADGWEVRHGFNPVLANPAADTDSDGMSDLNESLAGTNPRDTQSKLSVSARAEPNQPVELRWSAVPGRRYKLQVRDDLSAPYLDVIDPSLPRVATGPTEVFTLNISPSAQSQYYRVVVLPE